MSDARTEPPARPGRMSGIGRVLVKRGRPDTIFVGTTTAMMGMTAVRGGQVSSTGTPQARVGLYRTDDAGQSWSLVWVPPVGPEVPPNPHAGVGTLSEIFDAEEPYTPRGCIAQAWTVAEVLRAWMVTQPD